MVVLAIAVLGVQLLAPAGFNLSNTLGDGMVLQRGNATLVWGFGDTVGETITTTFLGHVLSPPAQVDTAGVWRQALPQVAESEVPTTLSFKGSSGSTAQLKDVLIGDVFLCSGVRLSSS